MRISIMMRLTSVLYIPHTKYNVDMKYILHLTYIHDWYKVGCESSSLTPFSAPLEFPRSPEANSSTEEKEMFGRQVTLRLKSNNSATELNRIAETEILPILRKQKGFRDESFLIAPERSEAIANSFWDTKADAEAYDHTAYG